MSQQELPLVALPPQEKNRFQNFEAFHYYLGQKVDLAIWLFVYTTEPNKQLTK